MKMIQLGLVVLLNVALLAGCAFGPAKTQVDTSNLTPEQTVQAALDALHEKDIPLFNQYLHNDSQSFLSDDMSGKDSEIVAQMFDNLSYQISDSSIDADQAIVNATITNTDFSGVVKEMVTLSLGNIFKGGQDDEAIMAELLSKANTTHNLVNSHVAVTLVKTNAGWKIKLDKETKDILLGNLGDFLG